MIGFEIDLVATVALGVWGPAIVLAVIWGGIRLVRNKLTVRRYNKARTRQR